MAAVADWRVTLVAVAVLGLIALAGVAAGMPKMPGLPAAGLRTRLAPIGDRRVATMLATTLADRFGSHRLALIAIGLVIVDFVLRGDRRRGDLVGGRALARRGRRGVPARRPGDGDAVVPPRARAGPRAGRGDRLDRARWGRRASAPAGARPRRVGSARRRHRWRNDPDWERPRTASCWSSP
nr:hypothetical protein [uncultured Actinoplanes sp.]